MTLISSSLRVKRQFGFGPRRGFVTRESFGPRGFSESQTMFRRGPFGGGRSTTFRERFGARGPVFSQTRKFWG